MNPSTRGVTAYRRIEAVSRSPLELTLMLYDGAIRFLTVANDAGQRGDLVARATAISRAFAIISELQNTLNIDAGGSIAENLDALYQFMNSRLVDATSKSDPAALTDVIKLLSNLRGAWAEISAPNQTPRSERA